MDFNSGAPIYSQISEYIKRRIASGELHPGDKVMAVRELAVEMGVNPNTMQKALAALEHDRLLYTERTSGRFVTSDIELIEKLKLDMLEKETFRYVTTVNELGCSREDARTALDRNFNRLKGEEKESCQQKEYL
ncbi:MAG: GntR family transcriptional regulator [Oscillospiraceae bacterium]|nr:GntR family transcriptional regulator [Oscillospiraceae bacterium]